MHAKHFCSESFTVIYNLPEIFSSIVSPLSILFLSIISAGLKRIVRSPHPRNITFCSRPRFMKVSLVFLSGKSKAVSNPLPLTLLIIGCRSAILISCSWRYSPVLAALLHKSSSSMISRILAARTMSTRLPPHVELIREGTLNTLFSTSSTFGPTRMPQTCIFLPKAIISGLAFSPKCS